MDASFWFERWREGRIGFHEGVANAHLVKYAGRLAGARRILVPLCGKAEDLAYLASLGHEVVGIELVEDAVRQFFAEHHATPSITPAGDSQVFRAGAITIVVGDFFSASTELVGSIEGIYDRAALVALPVEMRTRYAAQLSRLAPAAKRELLMTIEYPAGSYEGPPFSVSPSDVRALFANAVVEELDHAVDPQGRFGGKMIERCFELRW
jgi:thiopurine S-methyltransferase